MEGMKMWIQMRNLLPDRGSLMVGNKSKIRSSKQFLKSQRHLVSYHFELGNPSISSAFDTLGIVDDVVVIHLQTICAILPSDKIQPVLRHRGIPSRHPSHTMEIGPDS
jgi:hypothetical protein